MILIQHQQSCEQIANKQKIKASQLFMQGFDIQVGVAGFEPATLCSQSRNDTFHSNSSNILNLVYFFCKFTAKSSIFELKIGKMKLVDFSSARVLSTFGIFPCTFVNKYGIKIVE